MRPSVFVNDACDSASHIDVPLADELRMLKPRRTRAGRGGRLDPSPSTAKSPRERHVPAARLGPYQPCLRVKLAGA
jgi:hypothetical protein